MLHHYSRAEAAEILDIKPSRLRYWERIGLVQPSLREGRASFYDFKDLICLKTAQGLVAKGLAASRIKENIRGLREKFPQFEGKLTSKRIYVFGDRVIVSHRRRLIHSHSGRLYFKFDVDDFSEEVNSWRRHAEVEEKTAQEWFAEGRQLEGRPETRGRAVQAYQEAVKLEPRLAEAYVRMGALYHEQNKLIDAQRCFRIALRRNPYHSRACFELGNVLDEVNCSEEAVRCYEKAVEIDPEFSDAYFNLAATAEKLGLLDRAVRCWRAYLRFEPQSRHAPLARQRIKLLEGHLASRE